MDQIKNNSITAKDNNKLPVKARIQLTAEEDAEWDCYPRIIKKPGPQEEPRPAPPAASTPAPSATSPRSPLTPRPAGLNPRPASTPRPASPPPSTVEAGRTPGKVPGYGYSHRLPPGCAGPEYPQVPNLAQQDDERYQEQIEKYRAAESGWVKQIKDDTAELRLGFHPVLDAVLGPMLKMADDDIIEAAMERPSSLKVGEVRNVLFGVRSFSCFLSFGCCWYLAPLPTVDYTAVLHERDACRMIYVRRRYFTDSSLHGSGVFVRRAACVIETCLFPFGKDRRGTIRSIFCNLQRSVLQGCCFVTRRPFVLSPTT